MSEQVKKKMPVCFVENSKITTHIQFSAHNRKDINIKLNEKMDIFFLLSSLSLSLPL